MLLKAIRQSLSVRVEGDGGNMVAPAVTNNGFLRISQGACVNQKKSQTFKSKSVIYITSS
jgi:hypothetical protein